MSDEQIIEVVRAHMEGKQIQLLGRTVTEWTDVVRNDPSWNFEALNYRVKPEPRKPREWWLTPMKYGLCYMHDSPSCDALWHVREVIE